MRSIGPIDFKFLVNMSLKNLLTKPVKPLQGQSKWFFSTNTGKPQSSVYTGECKKVTITQECYRIIISHHNNPQRLQ